MNISAPEAVEKLDYVVRLPPFGLLTFDDILEFGLNSFTVRGLKLVEVLYGI